MTLNQWRWLLLLGFVIFAITCTLIDQATKTPQEKVLDTYRDSVAQDNEAREDLNRAVKAAKNDDLQGITTWTNLSDQAAQRAEEARAQLADEQEAIDASANDSSKAP